MNGIKVPVGQAWSNPADPALAEALQGYGHKYTASLTREVEVHAPKSQRWLGNSRWEIRNLEEELDSLELMSELPSLEDYICILQKCKKQKDLACAKRVHMHICNNGLEAHTTLGNYLVPMFVDCGSMSDAQQIFNRLVHRNEFAWTSLVQGYIECGESQHALTLFQKMQEDGVHPSRYTFVAALKACARLKCMERGSEIHAEILKEGYHRDIFVACTLVDMYAKCGSLEKAQEVFDELSVRTVVLWNALISGYAMHQLGEKALDCLKHMQLEGVAPDATTFVCSLKACGSIGAMDRGREIHIEITKQGLERSPIVGNVLVVTYAKCGSLAEAQEVLDMLPVQNAISWTALLAGYTEQGLGEEALDCFEKMQLEGVSPDAVTFVCGLKACGSLGAVDRVQKIHTEIVKQGFDRDGFVGNILVDMYAKSSSLAEAQEVFNKLPVLDVVSWTSLIAGYAECGLGEEAMSCFQQMQLEGGLSPNAVTFVCILKACSSILATGRGQEIHIEIAKHGYEGDPFVGNSLVDMYAKCGLLVEAQEVFDKLPVQDVVSWTALISGYVEHGLSKEALNCFEDMQLEGIPPNCVTFIWALKACGTMGTMDMGHEIHSEIVIQGFEGDPFIDNSLLDMYARCGSLAEAWEMLDKLPVRDIFSWNGLLAGYVEHELCEDALNCLALIESENVPLNAVTCVYSLKACASLASMEQGQTIHSEVIKQGLEKDPSVGDSLVDMYAKAGSLAEAREVFEKVPARDVVLWNVLIAGYTEHWFCEEALNCLEQMPLDGVLPDVVSWSTVILGFAEQGDSEKAFNLYRQMQNQGLSPDARTFVSILKASGNMAALETGRIVHAEVCRVGLETCELILSTALIDMYSKCGSMVDAQHVFNGMLRKDLMTWNALITGYARQGESEIVFHLSEAMRKAGMQPDGITFLSVLTVCSHAGLIGKGQEYFAVMSNKFGITPTIKHHNCMADLVGRAGQLDEAVAMLEKMPFQPDLVTWSTLLGACQKWGDVGLGRQAFEWSMRLGEKYAATFVLMANMFVDAYVWDGTKEIESSEQVY